MNSRPLVCEYLLTHSLEQLAEEHGVYARFSTKNPKKFTLNYNQLEARDADPISQECRGLVLEMENRLPESGDLAHPELVTVIGATKILARPMNRFFNYGQGAAAAVDFSDAGCRILEKLDGTLCIVYHDSRKNEWCVATRSVPDADLPVDGFGEWTFRSLFIKAIEETSTFSWKEICKVLDDRAPNQTLCFELMTPYNQVVVKHPKCRVALLAVRDNDTGQEWSYEAIKDFWCDCEMLNVPPAQQWKLVTIEDIAAFVNSRSGLDHEGVVAVQYNKNQNDSLCSARRVKIKSAAYLLASRTRSVIGASPRNLMELILQEQIDDLLPVLTDEQKAAAEKMRADLRDYMRRFDHVFHEKMKELKELEPMSNHVRRKTFARMVGGSEMWMAPAMAMYEGKAKSIHEWILAHKDRTNDKSFPSGFLDTLCKTVRTG